jgi:hypothetical protein
MQWLKATESTRPALEEMRAHFQKRLETALSLQANLYPSWEQYRKENSYAIINEKTTSSDPTTYEHAHNVAQFEDLLAFQVLYFNKAVENLSDIKLQANDRTSFSACNVM